MNQFNIDGFLLKFSAVYELVYHKIFNVPNVNPLSTNPTKWSNTLRQFFASC